MRTDEAMHVEDLHGTLRAKIEVLREALEPFAKIARDYAASDDVRTRQHRDERGPHYIYPATADHHHVAATLGDCRNARLALEHTAADEQTAGESK